MKARLISEELLLTKHPFASQCSVKSSQKLLKSTLEILLKVVTNSQKLCLVSGGKLLCAQVARTISRRTAAVLYQLNALTKMAESSQMWTKPLYRGRITLYANRPMGETSAYPPLRTSLHLSINCCGQNKRFYVIYTRRESFNTYTHSNCSLSSGGWDGRSASLYMSGGYT